MQRPPPGRRIRVAGLALAIAACSLALGAPLAAAALVPGQIDHAELTSSLRNQGLGGPIFVTATVYFGPDPHRLLYAENLKLNLTLPSGLTVTAGENPREFAAFEIPASATFYPASFSWTLNASRVGDYRIDLHVTSSSAGSAQAFVNVSVRVGPVLGKLTLQPGTPTTSAPLAFGLQVSTGFEDPEVLLNVTLYVYQTTESITPASATNNTLRLANADRTWNFVLGTPLRMADDGGGHYGYTIPPLARGALVYWVYAEARLSNGTVLGSATTAPVKAFIQDPGTTAAVFWGALATVTAIFGAALYVMMYDPFGRRPATGALHNSPDRGRVSVAILVAGLAILTAAVLMGSVVGLWRWFGYQ